MPGLFNTHHSKMVCVENSFLNKWIMGIWFGMLEAFMVSDFVEPIFI